ncbi:ParB/RepB/Spo0J family partition protein [Salinicoccus hispanicus]|uniref:ParB/RepB/Spo0J family partition protein n=1 Tax=Salinicoccus hispanicus TaxID=157225 RepID=A0A6N8U013_9STAP|nr:ParB/RepB/Spo0J family partition protein [Salinicoccus hispanicus]MXQ51588.1 ParB/RepB/Spo0J family partition protein [Salinicoccus hispanicus]
MARQKGLGKSLGKGLDAIFSGNREGEAVIELKISEIRRNPYQPRVEFNEEKLKELAESIENHGVIQPIIVRKSVKGYDIVAGERRYRASRLLNRETIPAIIKEMTDTEMMELAIIENLQRENLNPLEEALSYRQLMTTLNITQNEVAQRLGKSRPYIANMLRLLNLPQAIRQMINEDALSGAHGRTLLGLKDPIQMEDAAKHAMAEEMSVRALEAYVKSLQDVTVSRKQKQSRPAFIERHEAMLKERFGTTVEIRKKRKKGTISFEFRSEEEYKRIMSLLENE